jgi:hypothetical protein
LVIVIQNSSKMERDQSINQPPTHHAMDRRDRTTLDHAGDGPPPEVIELGRLTRRLAVQESVRPASVEAQHPVPDGLKPDAADLGRLGARRTVIDRRGLDNVNECSKPTLTRFTFCSYVMASFLIGSPAGLRSGHMLG